MSSHLRDYTPAGSRGTNTAQCGCTLAEDCSGETNSTCASSTTASHPDDLEASARCSDESATVRQSSGSQHTGSKTKSPCYQVFAGASSANQRIGEEGPSFRHVKSTEEPDVLNSTILPSSGHRSSSDGSRSTEPVTAAESEPKEQHQQQQQQEELPVQEIPAVSFSCPRQTRFRLQQCMQQRTKPHRDALVMAYERTIASGSSNPIVKSCSKSKLVDQNQNLEQQQTFVLVSGPSGTGKRRLVVSALRQLVLERDGGYYLQGHYDSMHLPVPYSGLVMAFDSFTCQVRRRGPEAVTAMRQSIFSHLGNCSDVSVLTSMIPSLSGILGCNRADHCTNNRKVAANNDDPIQRFIFAFRMFMRAITQDQPMVLVLHDLQFADKCSLDLLAGIATDLAVQSRPLCLVGTCDDSQAYTNSYLQVKLREIRDAGVQVNNISTLNAGPCEHCPSELKAWICDALSMNMEDQYDATTAERLARLAQSQVRSGGWILVVEFITWLQETELLTYRVFADGSSSGRWELSRPEELDFVLNKSDGNFNDQIHFLVEKLEQQFSEEMKQVLKVCSCVGIDVKPDLLEFIFDDPLINTLDNLVKGGVIVSCVNVGDYGCYNFSSAYMFEHEHMRHAAYQLIPEPEVFHLEIGRRLWRKMSSEQLEKYLFVVLSQMYMGRRLITRKKERVAIATLCLHAGRRAAKSSTFRTAAIYLEMGIDLLSYCEELRASDPKKSRCWRDEYDLTLALHCAAAEMTMCSARFEDTHLYLERVFENALSLEDKLPAYTTKMYTLSQQAKQQECIDLGTQILKQLGETFPTRLCNARLMREVRAVERLLGNKTNEEICRMPHISDLRKLNALAVLNFMILPSIAHRPRFAPFVFLKMTKITLQHGLSVFASGAFGTYGMMYIGATYKIEKGARFAQLALKLLEQFGIMTYLPRVYAAVYGCIHAWTKPTADALEPLLYAHRVGLSTGDAEYGGLCGNLYMFFAIDSGVNLGVICRMYSGMQESLVATKQTYMLRMTLPTLQTVHHFMGLTPDPLASKGDLIDFDEVANHLRMCGEGKKVAVKYCRMVLAFIFRDLDMAEKYILSCKDIVQTAPTFERVTYAFYIALVSIAIARREEQGRKYRKFLGDARKIQGFLKKLGRLSPNNCLDKSFLVQAEVASLLGQKKKAVEKYFCAIALAGDKNHFFMHALGNELLARHFLRGRGGSEDKAAMYLERSLQSYRKWGGMAKANRLKDEMRELHGISIGDEDSGCNSEGGSGSHSSMTAAS